MGPTTERDRLNDRDAERWLAFARRGDFTSAWLVSDRILARSARRQTPDIPRHLQQIWDGTPLPRQRVFVRCYHGLGDTIQFARFLPHLTAIADSVVVWAPDVLLELLGTMRLPLTLLPLHDGTPEVEFDVDIEIMELMYAFRATLTTIPRQVPYLWPEAAVTPATGRPRVGLFWRGGSWNWARSIPFALLEPLLATAEIEWRSLQCDHAAGEHDSRLQHPDTSTVMTLAKEIAGLDLVVSVDSMVAHLAGARGVPVWTLLSRQADWRWLTDRDDSPWYPTMRLFRQRDDEDWRPVVAQVADALAVWRDRRT